MAVSRKLLLLVFFFISFTHGHRDLPNILKEVSQASNTFGVNLHRTKTLISGGETNTLFSPLSIFTALAMLNVGARGETAYQLHNVLNWGVIAHPNDDIKPDAKIRKFLTSAFDKYSSSDVKFANSLWVQKYFCFSVCKRYAKILQRSYYSDIRGVSFRGTPEIARVEINSWVSQRTGGKIKELLERGSVTPMTRLVLTNAIYFKSNWKYRFDQLQTAKKRFTVSRGKVVDVDMMRAETKLMYTEDTENKVVELPYNDANISMVVILPRDKYGIKKLESSFTDKMLKRYLAKLNNKTVTLWLPKFKIESDIHLKDYLSLMGARDMFDPNDADLRGIVGFKGFFVTHAIHKALVEVNEEGTEAAAATGITAGFRSFNPDEASFIANHPFIFTIIHRPSATILFHGEIVDPTVRETTTNLK